MTKEQKSPEQLIDEMEKAEHPISSSDVQDAFQTTSTVNGSSSTVTLSVIIAAAVVSLGCVIACAAITIVFLQNPPW